MWDTPVVVNRERHVDAAPERVWELVGSPAALSALPPGGFAFAVPAAVPGTDRLTCVFEMATRYCHMYDVREEVPGQMVSWQSRSTLPSGIRVLTLSVLPRPRGCTVSITMRVTVPRPSYGPQEARQQLQVKDWIKQLQAIAEGRVVWPQAGMPESIQQSLAVHPPLKKPADASAHIVINAPADTVWQTVWPPETSLLTNPDVVFAGHVPGTPERAAGEMRYSVWQHPDSIFTAEVTIVREMPDGHRAVTQRITPPRHETTYLVTAVPGGTRLELKTRWTTRVRKSGSKINTAKSTEQLKQRANRYKTIIESDGQTIEPSRDH